MPADKFYAGTCGVREDESLDEGKQPGTVTRTCTDPVCLTIFMICMAVLCYLLGFAFQHGDPNRLMGLRDSAGQRCGISIDVQDKPYLYLCQEQANPDSDNGICVKACPNPEIENPTIDERYAVAAVTTNCPVGSPRPYATRPFAELLCVPNDLAYNKPMAQMFWRDIDVSLGTAFQGYWRMATLARSWEPIMVSVVMSLVTSFLVLCGLGRYPVRITWGGIGILVTVLASFGLYMIIAARSGGDDGSPCTGDSGLDLMLGQLLCASAFIILCVAANKRKSLDMAVECVTAADECIRDAEGMLLEPFFALGGKLGVMAFLLVGFVYLYSCLSEAAPGQAPFDSVGGVFDCDAGLQNWKKGWSYAKKNWCCENLQKGCEAVLESWVRDRLPGLMAFYVFMFFWIMELSTSASQFVTAYVTEQWFFAGDGDEDYVAGTKRAPAFGTIKAYGVVFRWHLGTLAYGSLLTGLFRPLRMLMASVVSLFNKVENACAVGIKKSYDSTLRYLHTRAYMDVSMNASRFCKGSYATTSVLTNEATAVMFLIGETWVVQLAGVGGVSALGAAVTYVTCLTMERYSNFHSPHYVQDPMFLSLFSGLLCSLVALPFMLIVGQVCDTLLYCIALDRLRWVRRPKLAVITEEARGLLANITCLARENRKEEEHHGYDRRYESLTPKTQRLVELVQHPDQKETKEVLQIAKDGEEGRRGCIGNPCAGDRERGH